MFCPKCGQKCGGQVKEQNDSKSVEDTQRINTKLINSKSTDSEFEEEFDDEPLDDDIFDKIRRKLTSSKKVIGISIAGVLFAFLIAFFLIGSSMSKPSDVVSKFQKAVSSDNKAQLVDMLYCTDSRLKIDENSVQPLITYFNDNPSYLNKVVNQLNNEAANSNEIFDSKAKFDIVYTGKKYLFFKNYKIAIKPSFISVRTGIKDVEFSLNGTQIAKSDSKNFSKQLGPFIPGKYKLNANYKNSFQALNESRNIDFINSNEDNINVEVFTDLCYVNINSDYENAEIFLNNKDTGIKAKDAINFGPLSSNSVIYGVASVNGQKLRSSDYVVKTGDNYAKLDFTQSQNNMAMDQYKMRNLIYWYTYYFTEAVNSGDFEIIENYLYPGSSLYNEQKSYVATTYEKGIKEDIKSFNVTSYNISDDKMSGTVSTEEVYNIYQKDSTEPSTKTFHYTYTFMYNEEFSGYQLSGIKVN